MSRPTSTLRDLARRLDKSLKHRREYRRQTPYHDLLLDVVRRRKELGITQKELAELAGIHQSQLSRIENAKHDARLSTIVKLAEALGTRVDMRLVPVVELNRADWDAMITIAAPTEPDTIEYGEQSTVRGKVKELLWSP